MRTHELTRALEWALFFATTVYGHVAMKLAVDGRPRLLDAALSLWGASALLAWAGSSVLWMLLLRRDTLFGATSVSSLRHIFTVAAALALARALPTPKQAAGAALIAAGVYLSRGAG